MSPDDKDKRYEVSKVYPGKGGNDREWHNIIGPEEDPKHGHVVIRDGEVVYERDYGERDKSMK